MELIGRSLQEVGLAEEEMEPADMALFSILKESKNLNQCGKAEIGDGFRFLNA